MERGKRGPAIIAFLQMNKLNGKTYIEKVGFSFFYLLPRPVIRGLRNQCHTPPNTLYFWLNPHFQNFPERGVRGNFLKGSFCNTKGRNMYV